ncbi:MAG: tRNA preQ1(34) S-adenosylmethionine ribosyltransferase-isomerase QueA [Patescibacteria group bacterium]
MNQYFYKLPKELIAQKPVEPRDSARLFVYNTKTNEVHFDIFKNCSKYIPEKSTLVINTTKVVPARVYMQKETGGKIEVLFLINEYEGGDSIKCIVDRKLNVGQKLFFPNRFMCLVSQQENQLFTLQLFFENTLLIPTLEQFGITPIPKYITENKLEEENLRSRYQSIFAKTPASIAAPTASLHFTDAVFSSLFEKGVKTADITLHVGMGTFAPVREEQLESGTLHKEWYTIPDETKKILDRSDQGYIIPVGTTAMRAIESYTKTQMQNGATNLFIKKPFEFKVASGLVTNFHVPESSLMYLVDAFLTHKRAEKSILDLYKIAIEERFRFYSFGDAMLIL